MELMIKYVFLQTFFHDKKDLSKLGAYCKRLRNIVEKSREAMTEEDKADVDLFLQVVSVEFENILHRVAEDEQKLQDIHGCWSAYNRAVQLSLPWFIEAERLLKEAEVTECKVGIRNRFSE